IGPFGLIEVIDRAARAFINSHHAQVGATSSKRALQSQNGKVCIWIRPGGARVNIHCTQLESAQRPGYLCSTVDWNLLTGDRVDSNLAAEEEFIGALANTHGECEDARVFQEELPFLWIKKRIRREIELLHVHITVCEICIAGKICNQVGAYAEFD